MTLDEARNNIGRTVVYCPAHGAFEDGMITKVNDQYVMVLYVGDRIAKATAPRDLWLTSEYNPRDAWRDWKAGK